MAEQYVFGSKRTRDIVSLKGKLQLAEEVKDCKLQYYAELESLKGIYHWDAKRKRHVSDTPKQGCVTKHYESFFQT